MMKNKDAELPTPPEMNVMRSGDRLHGMTLEKIVTGLVGRYGWEELGRRIDIKCFTSNPSIKSSLSFLRRTPGLENRWKICISPAATSDAHR